MPITIPDATKVRTAYDYPPGIPGVAGVAITAPGPLVVTNAVQRSGQGTFAPATGANNAAYIGFGLIPTPNVGEGVGALRHAIIAGFAGVVPGSEVYLDTANGSLTHTAASNGRAIGIGYTTEMIFFY